jgi:hypothetical protein
MNTVAGSGTSGNFGADVLGLLRGSNIANGLISLKVGA